jgi:hypothetical protein
MHAKTRTRYSEKFVVPEPPARKALRRKRWESADIAQQRGVRRLEQILLEGFTPGSAAADTDGSAESTSTSVIPQFLQRLYLTLPRHSGATADVDELLNNLATAVLPDRAVVTGSDSTTAAATATASDDVDIDMDDTAVTGATTVDSTTGEHHDVPVDVAGTAAAGVGGAADIDAAAQHQQQQQQQQQQQADHMQHSTAAAAGSSSSGAHAAYSNGGASHQQQYQQQQQQQQRNGSHKRRRNGDSDDEYDDEQESASGGHKRPLHDVFRQRQLAKLERAS